MTLIKHEMKQGRLALAIWTVSIAFLIVICVLLFPEMESQMNEVNDMFASMGSFSQAFGMDRLNFGEFMGFYGVECGNILGLGGAFFAAFTGILALAKEEKMTECAHVLYNVLESMRFIATMLAPYTPNISQDIYEQLNRSEKATDVKLDDLKWGEIPAGKITEKEKIKPVFLRLDSEIAGASKKG